MYARGILFGKMVLELGDTCTAKNDKTGVSADLDFKTKGFFSGTYNAIAGKVRNKGTEVGEIYGKWSKVMELKYSKVCRLFLRFNNLLLMNVDRLRTVNWNQVSRAQNAINVNY